MKEQWRRLGGEIVFDAGIFRLRRDAYEHEGRPTRPMEMSMLGVGVGFDTKGADKITLSEPDHDRKEFRVVPDTREGWYESVGDLLWSYFTGGPWLEFDYSQDRPAGELIKGFGGVAAGPGPLIRLHDDLRKILADRTGETLSSSDFVDICNLIGKCVVSGNVRRSAELALGDSEDEAFLDLKNYEVNPERMGADGWGHASNNSVGATVGGNYDHLVDGSSTTASRQHLSLLRNHGVIDFYIDGRLRCYFLVDPIIPDLLELLRKDYESL